MPSRPFFNFTLEDLRQHFRANSENIKILGEIHHELSKRTSSKAKTLAIEVTGAKQKLGSREKAKAATDDETAWRAIFKGGRPPGTDARDLFEHRSAPSTSTRQASPKPRARKDSDVQNTPNQAELERLSLVYEKLRARLLDMSLRNPMLNYRLSTTSKRQLQFFDEVPEYVYRQLVEKGLSLDVEPLPEPNDIPADERTPEFKAALEHAKVSDQTYLEKSAALAAQGKDSDEAELYKLEIELRDRLREKLGMVARPTRKTVSPIIHARSIGIDPNPDLKLESENPNHHDRKLQCLKWPDVADATLSRISDDARLAEQEMGLSTLFLVFGFLEWYENDVSSRPLFAPLLLLPVKLDKRRTAHGKIIHFVAALAEAPETNLSLEKRIEADFGRQLPGFAVDEDNLGSINTYLEAVGSAVEGLKRWRIRPWLLLGHFGFGRLAMYTDLSPDRWQQAPASNKLIQAILRGTDTPSDGANLALEPPDDYPVEDAKYQSVAPFLIHDADASQHSALIDALKGQNLVVQGPPGTGKSQTITNLIANALASDQRVLFLAEKQAALEVVKRRLDQAGLGDFCLELHSDRAASARVVESLKARHKLGYSAPIVPTSDHETGLQRARAELGAYLQALHNKPDGTVSAFDNIWASIRAETKQGSANRSLRNVAIPEKLLLDLELLNQARDSLGLYDSVKSSFETEFGPVKESKLNRLEFGLSANQGIFYGLESDLRELKSEIQNLLEAIQRAQTFGIDQHEHAEAIVAIDRLLPLSCPDPNLTGKIASLGTQAVRATIKKLDDLTGLEAAVPSNSELRQLSDDTLKAVIASYQQLAETKFAGIAYRNLPAEAAKVNDRSATCGRTKLAVAPILSELGYEDLAANSILAIVKGLKLIGQQPEQDQDWIAWLTSQNENAVLRAYDRWTRLTSESSKWRNRFPTCRRFPTIDELTEAEVYLKKGALGRTATALSSSTAKVKSVIKSLTGETKANLSPSELQELKSYLLAVKSFEHDDEFQRMFASAWAGLRTPLDYLYGILNVRKSARALFDQVAGGDQVFGRLDSLSSGQLRNLTSLVNTASTIDLHALGELGDRNLGVATNEAGRDADCAKLLLNPTFPKLMDEDQPLRAVADLAHQEMRRRQTAYELAALPAYQAAGDMFGRDDHNDGLRKAIDWIEVIDSRNTRPAVKALMLSLKSQEDREATIAAATNCLRSLGDFNSRVRKIDTEYQVTGFGGFSIDDLRDYLAGILDEPDNLRSYLGLQSYRREVTKFGLDELVVQFDLLPDKTHKYIELLDAVVAWKRADRARRTNAILSRVSGAGLEARRRDLIERDRQKIRIDRLAIARKLLGKRPPPGSSLGPKKTWTEMALIKREFDKERRFVPVRDLVTRAGAAVQALKPCFMMSPLSLAKFLPARKLDFDLLIVDEASQMRPEDALGAIMRVKQLVVVGDTKQLPPTDFFYRSEEISEEGDDSDNVDDESILEACQKTFGQMRMLRWHYRSKCESLIAFSNREFYNNGLITFPSSQAIGFSIDLVQVNGAYSAGTNPDEAQRVAEEAVALMRHYSESDVASIPTLGLVAVNSKQRDLIFEELRQREAGDEKVEKYREKVRSRGEPVFIKNLENVQGDERDFILISLTYGRERGQKVVAQRFGPIGGKQGHRRLNVLFSRARMRIGLFASMTSDDVRPVGSSLEGVAVLKRYLEYAERKGKSEYQNIGGEFESDFELEVAERLRARGYDVRTQIGVSGYRIDLAICNPEAPNHFLAGIECDGAQYHSSKSARDRDRLREEILTGLGWRIIRVWSADWFDNPNRETERICVRIEEIKKSHQTERRHDYQIRLSANEVLDKAVVDTEPSQPPDFFTTDIESPPRSPVKQGDNCAALLRNYRDTVIACEIAEWEPQRSLLRDGMIETLIAQRLRDPEDWFNKVPLFQRTGTNPIEKERYLGEVCELIDKNLDSL